ncbi:hypothetical protein M3182_00690 [Mesobacillus maritimus]|uniref:hypothetical protein n=1 Tax=Mesobacillus maritimus TaxID=1643336 RepID=UPI00203E1702|nr:hypothetical protein [Mesobacillus maritimus]MCM3584256.1 hypothetical protein [Mesobacillus maritimus]
MEIKQLRDLTVEIGISLIKELSVDEIVEKTGVSKEDVEEIKVFLKNIENQNEHKQTGHS